MTAHRSNSGCPGAEKLFSHSAKGGDVMKMLIDAIDIQVIFALVMLALYMAVLGFVFL